MEGIQYGIQQGYNPMTAAAFASQPYASQFGQPQFGQPQFGQQGLVGGGAPFGGLIGSGIPGLLSGQNVGRQPGQANDSFNGGVQPFNNVDPMTAAHLQQAHLAQLAQQVQLAQQLAQQQLSRSLPFSTDPMSAMIAQQRAQFGPLTHAAGGYDGNPLNRIDPFTAAYLQQAQIAKLYQQLALQIQLGQQAPYGNYGQGSFGQGQYGYAQPGQTQSGWFTGGPNPWVNPQFGAPFGRTNPFPYGSGGGQFPGY